MGRRQQPLDRARQLLDPHPLYRWPVIARMRAGGYGLARCGDIVVGLAIPCWRSRQRLAAVAWLQGTQGCDRGLRSDRPSYPERQFRAATRAADIILGRRSAQRFDSKFSMSTDVFYDLLDGLLDRPTAPWDVWNFTPRLHPIFLVHRVEGLAPGVYALPRHPAALDSLRQQLRADFEWDT